ncbi:MAG: hypothetical protein NTY53_20855 [Kiritimatiellaeota bacterium]|nr:hypothetical protein [Kiritimatiellota bacterium]
MKAQRPSDWTNSDGGDALVACAEKAREGIPLTLDETARVLNATGHYRRPLMRMDVLRIERRALQKIRLRLCCLN